MSVITIKYGDLEEASSYSKKLSQNLSGYADELSRKITSPINSLPGNDKRGYASGAAYSASRKISELRDKSNRFNSFSQKVDCFASNAQKADSTVASSIKRAASSYVGERSWWQGACDAIWNFLFVDIANSTDIGRTISDCVKSGWSYVTQTAEKVRDWFKHGDGKYIWNIVSGITAGVLAVVGAITAVAAAIAGGPIIAVIIAIFAAAAAILGGVITIANSSVKIYNNAKALMSDDPGVSRYLGNIEGISDAVDKYDMGDAEDNAKWETGADVVDKTKLVCDTIGIIKGVTDLGAVKSDITGRITGYKFNKNNIMTNIRKSMGFDFDKNKFTMKGMFGVGAENSVTSSWYANKNGYGGFKWLMNRHTSTQNTINFIANGASKLNKIMSSFKSADTVYESIKQGYDFSSTEATLLSIKSISATVIEIYEGLGNHNIFGGLNKITIKPYKNIAKHFKEWGWGDKIIDHLSDALVPFLSV